MIKPIPYSSFQPIVTSLSLPKNLKQDCYTWIVPSISPFDELLLSWNAFRPSKGHYVILVSAYVNHHWSSWLLYAVWGANIQYSFQDKDPNTPIRAFQDQVEITNNQYATGFRVCIKAYQGATFKHFYRLYACTSNLKSFQSSSYQNLCSCPCIHVPKISQIRLKHPRATSLCSPTSTTSVIQFALNHALLDPLEFAKSVYDAAFDIYGNWSFNIAQAFVELGNLWQCLYLRAQGFHLIHYLLKQKLPVVVSIKGKLRGSLSSYSQGHLLVIQGYDSVNQQVLCMDPAFPLANQTRIAYALDDFMQAWEKRYYLCYLFIPLKSTSLINQLKNQQTNKLPKFGITNFN